MKTKGKRINEHMEKRKDIDEFLKRLEETFGKIMEEIDTSDRPVDINISVNVYPLVMLSSEAFSPGKQRNVPVDILETETKVHAVVALPGMDCETIKLNCNGRKLEVTANNAEIAIQEIIELPARVIKSGMKTRYENGILEVVFNKSKMRKSDKKSNP
ncbi:MAG: Hsp20/alpha crystallin family protein [Candidatus Methanoperedens sp.]|nr:Hsp20/alpha crystallin family protein [Candidatus Methanoperedens sp.]MCE8426414.1 Hsp20/alpha crystallin family protein [Candidatus Methanoperedens sp.]MCE8429350.1 Hsp20/alpha crystallin family protein [Candidatus Methanoperedens sp.]